MTEVWKFPLQLGQTTVHNMPANAQVLTVQMQHGVPTLWARVTPSAFPEPRDFMVVGTGHPILNSLAIYIGTVQDGGGFVWHVFEEPRR